MEICFFVIIRKKDYVLRNLEYKSEKKFKTQRLSVGKGCFAKRKEEIFYTERLP